MSWIKTKILKSRFKRKFVRFNKYTAKAFKLKTDEDFKRLCLECMNEIAGENKKDIKSVSLDDIWRVLNKIRKKTPKLLRKITLYQIINLKNISSSMSNTFSFVHSILSLTPVPLMFVGLKKIFGKKVEYAFKIYIVSMIAEEIYKGDKECLKN